jgi:predicted metal-dependent HD superfamily phosphohydrolase
MFRALDTVLHRDPALMDADCLQTFKWAVFFHDCVYLYEKAPLSSEKYSLNVATRMLEVGGARRSITQGIVSLIHATEYSVHPIGSLSYRDEESPMPHVLLDLIRDLDLMAFSGDWDAYASNTEKIFAESQTVDRAAFNATRLRFLNSIAKQLIYATSHFNDRNLAAQKNIAREIEILSHV